MGFILYAYPNRIAALLTKATPGLFSIGLARFLPCLYDIGRCVICQQLISRCVRFYNWTGARSIFARY